MDLMPPPPSTRVTQHKDTVTSPPAVVISPIRPATPPAKHQPTATSTPTKTPDAVQNLEAKFDDSTPPDAVIGDVIERAIEQGEDERAFAASVAGELAERPFDRALHDLGAGRLVTF